MHKSMGLEAMHPRMLMELADVIAKPLAIISENPWRSGEVLDDWKKGRYSAHLLKKGRSRIWRTTDWSVSPQSPEKLWSRSILKHLEERKVIRNSQHGFTKVQSFLTNLIAFYDEITGSVDTGNVVGMIYVDFSKAFDMVSHSILASKLTKYGLDEWTIRWIESWLDRQAQQVVINGSMSSWQPVSSRVPQGLVLGLLLFNIFINDLNDGMDFTLSKFMDDTKLWGEVGTQEGRDRVHSDLRQIGELGQKKSDEVQVQSCT
ncbi:unnamed protein product [Lepidochelys kempii]